MEVRALKVGGEIVTVASVIARGTIWQGTFGVRDFHIASGYTFSWRGLWQIPCSDMIFHHTCDGPVEKPKANKLDVASSIPQTAKIVWTRYRRAFIQSLQEKLYVFL